MKDYLEPWSGNFCVHKPHIDLVMPLKARGPLNYGTPCITIKHLSPTVGFWETAPLRIVGKIGWVLSRSSGSSTNRIEVSIFGTISTQFIDRRTLLWMRVARSAAITTRCLLFTPLRSGCWLQWSLVTHRIWHTSSVRHCRSGRPTVRRSGYGKRVPVGVGARGCHGAFAPRV